jgi:fermentation-respiration switch protein FrsA (DUF1100 family)
VNESDASARLDVAFDGFDGTQLSGWWYPPRAGTPAPALALAHGFSAVKEMALDCFAAVFHAAGFGVLVYDQRNLGTSAGEPRQEIDPWGQTRDYRAAIDWLVAQPDVDPDRIGIWGSSFSGGEVIIVGACDDRVRAVVANVPLAGLPGVDYADTAARFAAIRDRVCGGPETDASRTEDVLGPFAVVREEGVDLPAYLAQEESSEWFLRLAGGPDSTWRNRITLRNAFAGDPATEDRLADTQVALAAFARAGEPKQLVQIEGHHFVPYAGAAFEQAAGAARDFFLQHLAEPPGR